MTNKGHMLLKYNCFILINCYNLQKIIEKLNKLL